MAKDVSNPHHGGQKIDAAVSTAGPVSLQDAIEAIDAVTAVWAAPDHPPLLASGRAAVVTGHGPERFQAVKRAGHRLLNRIDTDGLPRPARPRLFGGFSFFDETELDPPWTDFDPAGFVLPEIQLTLAAENTLVTGFGPGARSDRLAHTGRVLDGATDGSQESVPSDSNGEEATPQGEDQTSVVELDQTGLRAERSKWVERVREVTEIIEDTDLQKAVLAAAFDLEIDDELHLGRVLTDLEVRYPNCYRFSFIGPNTDPTASRTTFFGASPERLVEKQGQSLRTEALAGTVERGPDSDTDEAQITRLLDDQTLATEHQLVANQITEQLHELEASVEVGNRTVRTLSNVHHLETPISASLPPEVHVLDVVELLHPTPAVGGLPTAAARETIAEIESTVRGWYGAPVGWFDKAGDGTFAVGIRSALAGPDRATLFAGNGIVAGSDPETEWHELEAKFEPIREVLQ